MAIVGGTTGLDGMLSSLGLSRQFADRVGGSLRTGKLDPAAMQALLYTMYNSVNLQQAANGVGAGGIPPSGFVPGPGDYLRQNYGPNDIPPTGIGFGGISRENAYGSSQLARSMQVAMLTNPAFVAQLEKAIGGTMVPDGRTDGQFSAYRSPYTRTGSLMKQALARNEVPRSPMAAALAGTSVPIAGNNLSSGSMGGVLKGMMAMEANIKSTVQGWNQQAGQMSPSVMQAAQQAGINTSNPSFEDVVFLQLMSYANKKEQDIAGKVRTLDQGLAAGGAQQENGGFFGGLTDPAAGGQTAQDLFGQVQANTAPGAVGGVAGVNGATGSLLDGVGGGLPNDPNKMSDTMKQQMLQKMMGDLQKMYEMLSNIIKSMHDMQMTPIRNLKG